MDDEPESSTGKTTPAQLTPVPVIQAGPLGSGQAAPSATRSDALAPSATQAPVLSAASESVRIPPSADISPAAQGITSPATLPYAPAIGGAMPRPAELAPPSGGLSTKEQTLVALLRMLERLTGPSTLSPLERPFIAAAEMMFNRLARECEILLNRKPADLIQGMAKPGITPGSVSNTPPRKRASAKSKAPARRGKAAKSKSKRGSKD